MDSRNYLIVQMAEECANCELESGSYLIVETSEGCADCGWTVVVIELLRWQGSVLI